MLCGGLSGPHEVQNLYEVKFKEVTEKYFQSSPWPEANSIASEVDGDELFLLFYRFVVYYRQHSMKERVIYVKIHPLSYFDHYVPTIGR